MSIVIADRFDEWLADDDVIARRIRHRTTQVCDKCQHGRIRPRSLHDVCTALARDDLALADRQNEQGDTKLVDWEARHIERGKVADVARERDFNASVMYAAGAAGDLETILAPGEEVVVCASLSANQQMQGGDSAPMPSSRKADKASVFFALSDLTLSIPNLIMTVLP